MERMATAQGVPKAEIVRRGIELLDAIEAIRQPGEKIWISGERGTLGEGAIFVPFI